MGDKPYPWTKQLEDKICEDIESGLSLREVAKKNGISKALILKKAAILPEFRDRYAHAIELRTDTDFEGLIDAIDMKPEYNEKGVDSGWVNWKRLQIDTIKWALSKRNPKKYSDKLGLEHSGELGIKTVLVPAPAKKVDARPENKPEFDE